MTEEQTDFEGLFEPEIRLMKQVADGTAQWGAATGAMWPRLARLGYLQPGFLGITDKGRDLLERYRVFENQSYRALRATQPERNPT